MKSKYGVFSAAFVAASVLLGSGEASAGGNAWWGRAGYGVFGVREIFACIDDFTAELRLAFRAPGSRGRNGFVVSADLWGDAVCVLPPPLPVPLPVPVDLDDGWYDDCGGAPLPPPVVLPPPPLPPPVPIREVVFIDGYATYDEIALRGYGNWYYADFDILPLIADICGPGDLEDILLGRLTIYIDGRPFVLTHDLPPCAAGWYGAP